MPTLYGCRIFSHVGWNYAGCVVGALGTSRWNYDPLALDLEPGVPCAISAEGVVFESKSFPTARRLPVLGGGTLSDLARVCYSASSASSVL